MNSIRLLPDDLANKIAAGEVVQRPASVVKELLENAVDAGATAIKLLIKESGRTSIQVIDDGMGMDEVDARLCFERHATSKIKSVEDLFNIRTLGFRGEALAAIAAVAQVVLKTATQPDSYGTQLIIEGSQLISQEKFHAPKGTDINIKNLFFNIPARRSFLKSNLVETKHIIEEFQRVALASPTISFSFYQDEVEIYKLPGGNLGQRIVNLFGKNYQEQLIPCQEQTDLVKIKGYLGAPTQARKSRGEQFFFVNGRFVKSNLLNSAVRKSFDRLLPDTSFPFYAIFIELPPAKVDINVHPTKTEVKFDDERLVYSILQAVTRKALATHHISPAIDFEADINFASLSLSRPSGFQERKYAQFSMGRAVTMEDFRNEGNVVTQNLFTSALPVSTDEPTLQHSLEPSLLGFMETMESNKDRLVCFQFRSAYLVVVKNDTLVFIHQQWAHEQILYERYKYRANKPVTQQLLFAHRFPFNPAHLALLGAATDEMQQLGFTFHLEETEIVITGLPADVEEEALLSILEDFLAQCEASTPLETSYHDIWCRSLARKTSVRIGKKLPVELVSKLIADFYECRQTQFTPRGKPFQVTVTPEMLNERFGL